MKYSESGDKVLLRESLALLKILALSQKSFSDGKFKTASKSFKDIRARIKIRRVL